MEDSFVYTAVYVAVMMLTTIFINITAAGWLVIKMAEFMWERVRNPERRGDEE